MASATMTSKGQLTVPKEVREDLGLVAGSQVMFIKIGDNHYRLMARTGDISDLAGILHRPDGPRLTIEEMNDAIADAAADSGMRGLRPE